MSKKFTWAILACFSLSIILFSFTPNKEKPVKKDSIEWYTIEEAIRLNKNNKKKIFIDIYTDWCGWCKKMDQQSFKDPEVIEYINDHFYAVKFNAEQKKSIQFKAKNYEYMKYGRKGVHQLAYHLLDRNMSYPAFVVLDENLDRLDIIKGFLNPSPFLTKLKHHLK